MGRWYGQQTAAPPQPSMQAEGARKPIEVISGMEQLNEPTPLVPHSSHVVAPLSTAYSARAWTEGLARRHGSTSRPGTLRRLSRANDPSKAAILSSTPTSKATGSMFAAALALRAREIARALAACTTPCTLKTDFATDRSSKLTA